MVILSFLDTYIAANAAAAATAVQHNFHHFVYATRNIYADAADS